MKRARKLPRPPRQRNPVARSPLLGKGGPHERPASGKRQQGKREVERALEDLDRG